MKALFFLLLLAGLLVTCTRTPHQAFKSTSPLNPNAMEFYGLLKKTGVTSYMYGTHTIERDGKSYALKSSTVNLDAYVNKSVTISGTKVAGYPVDGGPEFVDVTAIR